MERTSATHEERLEAAHAALIDGVAKAVTSADWQAMLHLAGSFHRYSPNNQLLLAVQGAQGLVASFHTWKQIPATDGQICRIRKGETALRVYAPIRARREEVDEDTGLPTEPAVVGYRLVPVFHQGQLVVPPDLPMQPRLLDGEDPPLEVWEAITDQINAAGFLVRRGPIDGPDGPKGITDFVERAVTIRDDLSPAQALKTQVHELGHILMHMSVPHSGTYRDRLEVEAESVAYVVCDLLGVDAAEYSIPYVATWAKGDKELVHDTAQNVLATARKIVAGLEATLGVDLRPNPIADALAASRTRTVDHAPPERLPAPGTTDEIIYRHLAAGAVDWPYLAASLPAVDQDIRVRTSAGKPSAQAILLAEAGASAEANVAVLRAHGLDDTHIRRYLTVTVPDALGARNTLYHPDEVATALSAPRHVKAPADELVADLLVSTGRHPAAVRHLVETSGQPSNVISIVEERLRRVGPPVTAGLDRRSERGLNLIDEWSARPAPALAGDGPGDPPPSPEPPVPAA